MFNFTTKIINCPYCSKKMRIPTNRGKIRINCPHCKGRFEATPMPLDMQTVKKRLQHIKNTVRLNFKKHITAFAALPVRQKLIIYIVAALFIGFMLLPSTRINNAPVQEGGKNPETSPAMSPGKTPIENQKPLLENHGFSTE